jgi:hypothetical protein
VNGVAASVPGSSAARVAMRNEIKGPMIEKGLPSFYLTLNPADVFNQVDTDTGDCRDLVQHCGRLVGWHFGVAKNQVMELVESEPPREASNM